MYEYLIGSLFLFFVWILIYTKRKALRKQILWTSIFVGLFGFTEPLYVPEYWRPPTLFDLANKIGFDIESLIFTFAIGGLITSIYYLVSKSKTEKIETKKGVRIDALLFSVLLFASFLIFTDINPGYTSVFSMSLGGVFILLKRPDLTKKIIFSAVFFTLIYFISFKVFIFIFPSYVENFYSLSNLSGNFFLGVPIEEFLFAFSVSFLWSGMYEYVNWYKIKEL